MSLTDGKITLVSRSLTQFNPEDCGYTKVAENEYEQYTDDGFYVRLKRVEEGWHVTVIEEIS